MLCIDGERKRQGRLGLHVVRGQSPGRVGLICNTQFIRGAESLDTYIQMYIYIYIEKSCQLYEKVGSFCSPIRQ